MHCTRKVSNDITWVGGNDRRLALFENLFPIPRGVSYNSYLIVDEKTALMDTADASVTRQFMDNVEYALGGRTLDYLVVNHMEPDHCANIEQLLLRYPALIIVGNAMTFQYIAQFYGKALENKVVVKENDVLELGKHTLHFMTAPMVHWPEVMLAYESTEKILFSADAFGTFGALDGNLFADEVNFDRDWLADARRYYTNIVGKYGVQVQAALKKAAALEIRVICPLHGPVWREKLAYLLDKYDKWSRYEPEEKAVVIFYGSMYGNTENAAQVLACKLGEAGIRNVKMYDVSGTHVSELIAETFRCSHIVLAAPTYNAGIYPAMENLLTDMQALNVQGRTVGVIENGTWGCVCGKKMKEKLAAMKDMLVLEQEISLKSSLQESGMESVDGLRDAIVRDLKQE